VRRPEQTLVDVLVLLALGAYAVPFFWQLLTSFKPETELLRVPPLLPSRLTLAHYSVVLEQSLIPRALVNSVGIATLTTLLALAVGVPGAYAIARLPLPGKGALLLAIVASTAFPQIATVSPLYLLMRTIGLRDTWAGLVLVHSSFALPLTIWTVSILSTYVVWQLGGGHWAVPGWALLVEYGALLGAALWLWRRNRLGRGAALSSSPATSAP